jgi:hypothetical protein
MKKQKIKKTNISLKARQTYNPLNGIIRLENDKIFVEYNPFENFKPDNDIHKIDEYALTVYESMKSRYEKKPKKVPLNPEKTLNLISKLNNKYNPYEIFNDIFKIEGLKIKFKLYNEKETNTLTAKFMVYGFEEKIRNFTKNPK